MGEWIVDPDTLPAGRKGDLERFSPPSLQGQFLKAASSILALGTCPRRTRTVVKGAKALPLPSFLSALSFAPLPGWSGLGLVFSHQGKTIPPPRGEHAREPEAGEADPSPTRVFLRGQKSPEESLALLVEPKAAAKDTVGMLG